MLCVEDAVSVSLQRYAVTGSHRETLARRVQPQVEPLNQSQLVIKGL